MKPRVAADRKKVRPPAAVAVGADLRTFRYAGDVFSDPDRTTDSVLITGPRAALNKRDARRLHRRPFTPPPPRIFHDRPSLRDTAPRHHRPPPPPHPHPTHP